MEPLEISSPLDEPLDQHPAKTVREIQSSELFKHCQTLLIRHDGQDYRLRITRQNKLILTK